MPQLRRRLTLVPSPQAPLRSQLLQVWLPNGVLMRCQIGCAGQQQQQKRWTRRAGRSGQSGEVERGVRASVRITLNHALTMSQGPASAAVPSLPIAAWPRPIWQQSFVSSAASCFPCSYSLHLRLFVLRLHWDIFALLRRMNFYLPATVAESRVHVFMNFSALCRRQCGWELTF